MGRSYCFECSKCGYRAKVSGKRDEGLNLRVETISCRECKKLYDAVTRWRVFPAPRHQTPGSALGEGWREGAPPGFETALNRLRYGGLSRARWVRFPLCCPVSAHHKVRAWTHPGKCPRCGLPLERDGMPFRIWE